VGPTATTHTVTATNTGGSTATTLSILVEEVIINSASITINDNAAASLYPSAIVVLPTDGTITKVTAAIYGLTHVRQNDLDILLVGPSGQKVLLMSDVGGSASAVGVNLTFDDTAATSLTTDAVSIPTGTYKPSNSGTSPDPFSAPAPAAPYDLTLSVFNGTNPTGTWSLYVMDDRLNNTGSISGGWRLSLEITAPPAAPASLSYSSNPATYTKSTAIPDNTPTSSGGAVVSYAVSPALPAGLTLNTSTGVISGTPTTLATAADYTVTATNTGGSTTASVSIMVNDVAPSSLSYSSNPATYTKDTVISDNAPTSNGGAVVSYAVSPALPAGLTLNTSTGVISGTPSAESVAAIHTVTATNTGGSTTADLGITVVSAYSAWSTQYQLTQGPEGDDDGDGNSNYFEFVAGLVPNNAASVFKTKAAPVSGQANQMAIVFRPIISGRTYKVKSSDSLASGTWIELVNPIVSDASDVRTIIDSSATGDRKFYVIEITTP
jgi:subtilisin-like proprotein convertase family protein